MKKFIISCTLVLAIVAGFAQVKSPEAFLGYAVGSQYTPHHQLIAYFQHVASASQQVQLAYYGTTTEHRPLLVAFVGTAENIRNLESIRKNNLRLAKLQRDGQEATTQTPTIVWLSYNVHGNEPASSEAAMQTLFALVNPDNTQTKQWLKNTVVVIDPCLNPDGRDRYVNWFNSVVGSRPDVAPLAREHQEPWPRGRSNHYNFDLNRDWAWQTQVESKQRVALYNQWLPQVHVDFHEQAYNDPYYFAPAAEPYHEVLTQWQRDFQKIIGKNHAKYFDEKGWLYFTKERFDLFYPSYGDTYPLYSGSIGMTYEQGGIGAGLAVLTNAGDTLTLAERIAHHYTTGLSTIETASLHAAQLLQAFHEYFTQAVAGNVGAYKTYIIKHSLADEQRIDALKKLLDKNGISYGSASGSGRGYNYFSKKEENFSITPQDVIVATNQPKAALVKVLFEPDAKLFDSVTYDITAWALPYAYGLNTYASKKIFAVNTTVATVPSTLHATGSSAYGYVMPWGGPGTARAVAQLLQEGIRLRFAEREFVMHNQKFASGTIIITKNGNASQGSQLWPKVQAIAQKNNSRLYEAGSGMVDNGFDFGSSAVKPLKAPNVVLLTGNDTNPYAAGEVWNYFDNELQYPLTLVNSTDLQRIDWAKTDVLLLPDGNYDFLSDKIQLAQLTGWIRNGGKLIALEAAVQQLSRQEWSVLKLKESKPDSADKKEDIKTSVYANREKAYIMEYTPGSIFRVTLDNTHPLFFGYPNFYYTLKMDGNIYEPIKAGGWNVGIIKADRQVAGFVGSKLSKSMKNGVLFAVQDMGRGSIVYLADDVLFRSFWENGKLLFANAVFLVGQ